MVLSTGFPPIDVDPVSIKTKSLSNHPSAWFIIQVLFTLNSSTLETIKDKCEMSFRSEDMVRTGIFQKYLSSSQVSCLQENAQVEVFQPNAQWKTRISTNNYDFPISVPQYLVRAPPTWSHSNISRRVGSDLYEVTTADLKTLVEDPEVLIIESWSPVHAMNRFTSGFLRGGEQQNEFSDDPHLNLSPPRYLWNDLTGEGEIVTVQDSGLYVYSPFFYDADVPFQYNKTLPDHRKIIRYDAFIDSSDRVHGHGTHTSGTVAGSLIDSQYFTKVSRFEGIAPGAKIHFIDVENTSNPSGFSVASPEQQV